MVGEIEMMKKNDPSDKLQASSIFPFDEDFNLLWKNAEIRSMTKHQIARAFWRSGRNKGYSDKIDEMKNVIDKMGI